jgi:hypothetical protein
MHFWSNRSTKIYYHADKDASIRTRAPRESQKKGKQVTWVSMFFKKSTTDDMRRYNIPKIG